MRQWDAFRVGLAVVLGMAAFAWVTFYVRKGDIRGEFYIQGVRFENAQGVQEGAYVRVSGVTVGQVKRVDLAEDGKAILGLQLPRKLRLTDTDLIRIVGGIFSFSPPHVEITRRGEGREKELLAGQNALTTDAITTEAGVLVQNLNGLTTRLTRLTESLTGILENQALRGALSRSAQNLEAITTSGVTIAANMERTTGSAARLVDSFQATSDKLDVALRKSDSLFSGLDGAVQESRGLFADSRALVGDVREVVRQTGETVKGSQVLVQESGNLVRDTRGVLADNKERFASLLGNLDLAVRKLDGVLSETQKLVGDEDLRNDFKSTARSIREATDNLRQISADVRSLTSDPSVQEDLRSTISGLRETTEQAQDIFRRVRGVIGTSGQTARSIGQRLSEVETRVALVHGLDSGQSRFDLDATIPWSGTNFYRIGFYDFGESDKLVAQAGQRTPRNTWTRLGIYAGTLGIGLDVGSRQRPAFSLDLFGVDRPSLDARAHLRIAPYLDFGVGLEGIFRRADPAVGLYYRR